MEGSSRASDWLTARDLNDFILPEGEGDVAGDALVLEQDPGHGPVREQEVARELVPRDVRGPADLAREDPLRGDGPGQQARRL